MSEEWYFRQSSIPMLIRLFRPEDQPAACELILQGLSEHWGALDQSLNPDLADIAATYGQAIFLVAVVGPELVGTGALIPEREGVGRIVRMSVAQTWRRQGVGRQILAELLRRAAPAGYRQIVLETTATWAEAIAFYRNNGFREVGVWEGDMHFVMNGEWGSGAGAEAEDGATGVLAGDV